MDGTPVLILVQNVVAKYHLVESYSQQCHIGINVNRILL